MKAFLDLTPEQRAAMGRAGRALMERDFDKEVVVSATLDRILAQISDACKPQTATV